MENPLAGGWVGENVLSLGRGSGFLSRGREVSPERCRPPPASLRLPPRSETASHPDVGRSSPPRGGGGGPGVALHPRQALAHRADEIQIAAARTHPWRREEVSICTK